MDRRYKRVEITPEVLVNMLKGGTWSIEANPLPKDARLAGGGIINLDFNHKINHIVLIIESKEYELTSLGECVPSAPMTVFRNLGAGLNAPPIGPSQKNLDTEAPGYFICMAGQVRPEEVSCDKSICHQEPGQECKIRPAVYRDFLSHKHSIPCRPTHDCGGPDGPWETSPTPYIKDAMSLDDGEDHEPVEPGDDPARNE